jgi:monofunctional glycosyltransferase
MPIEPEYLVEPRHRRPYRRPRRGLLWRLSLMLRMTFAGALLGLMLTVALILPWRALPLPCTSFMIQNAVGQRSPYQYTWVSGTEITGYAGLAVMASEDQKFPYHHGFDWDAIQSAMEEGGKRGGSTISQQVAKNLFLWPGHSFLRKGLEAWFTYWIELLWPKSRILEVYLNIAQFGPHTFGVGAASQQFFGKPPSQMTMEESALLAAVLPGPELYDVANPSNYVYSSQDWILGQMDQLGGLSYLEKVDAR